MRKYPKKSTLSLPKVLKYIGKPAFFLFTIIVIGTASYLLLLKHFVQSTTKTFKKVVTSFQSKAIRHPKSQVENIRDSKINLTRLSLKIASVLFFFAFSGYLAYWYIVKDLPSVNLLTDSPPSLSTKIYDRNGELLYQIYKDENRSLISLSNIPKYIVDATISAEDKNFYHHFGIDPIGISRAALNNLKCSIYKITCSLQGGSTITQQLVKNTLLTPEKTIIRKIKELILAIETEHKYSKDQILEMYLNQVGYGGTAYGIEEAAHQYFGKSATELTLSESAMLAGLPISPTILSPYGMSPYLGKIRQQQVLENMVQTNTITESEKVNALSVPLVFHPQGISIKAPHFVMYVKDILVKQYGEATVALGGLEVRTSLDLDIQEILQKEINAELLKLTKLHVQNGAGLVISPKSGEIIAMVGSRDFFDSQNDGQVNITLQNRQPGSAIKPITYALALSNGLTPSSTIDDTPVCFAIKGQPDYCPRNYDGKFHGKVSARTALGSSYNIPAIKLLNTYGLKNMIGLAKQLGITTWDDSSRFGLSLTLGGGEITMLDLATVYSVFANNGTKIPLNPIIAVTDSKGQDITAKNPENKAKEVISPGVAYQINSILSDSSARAPAFGINSILNLPGKNIAVKTGTTNNLRDNWTFGYTSDILVATWVGNNDNTSMSSVASGVTGASPIWAHTMKSILKDKIAQPFTSPENIEEVNLACSGKPKLEYFIQGSAPKLNCANQTGTLLKTAESTSL